MRNERLDLVLRGLTKSIFLKYQRTKARRKKVTLATSFAAGELGYCDCHKTQMESKILCKNLGSIKGWSKGCQEFALTRSKMK